ncbi:MAG: monovalent cation/H(+) antiporter subunit G [Eubacterium sp.]|nr:monovalent cation/H(+) antiporter subunit G [Eubacterium sp.]
MEWVRFFLTAFFLILAVISFASAALGVGRFSFVLNRIHAAGIGDTMGLFCAAIGVMIGSGDLVVILKLVLIVVFMWCTSPVSGHFLGLIEYYMNAKLNDHVERLDKQPESENSGLGSGDKEGV